jgi:hypothetical protein
VGELVDGWLCRYLVRAQDAEREAERLRAAGERMAEALRKFAVRHRAGCSCQICGPLAEWAGLNGSWLIKESSDG